MTGYDRLSQVISVESSAVLKRRECHESEESYFRYLSNHPTV